MLSVDFPGKKHVRNTLQSVEWKETPVKVSPHHKSLYLRQDYLQNEHTIALL